MQPNSCKSAAIEGNRKAAGSRVPSCPFSHADNTGDRMHFRRTLVQHWPIIGNDKWSAVKPPLTRWARSRIGRKNDDFAAADRQRQLATLQF